MAAQKVEIATLKVQEGSNSKTSPGSLYVTWNFDNKFNLTSTKNGKKTTTKVKCNATKYLDHYEVVWQYYTGASNTTTSPWFPGTSETIANNVTKVSVYAIPSNATKVRVKIKPVSKKYKVTTGSGKKKKTKEKAYYSTGWATSKEYIVPTPNPETGELKDPDPPETPSAPEFTYDPNTGKVYVKNENLAADVVKLNWQIVKTKDGGYKNGLVYIDKTVTVRYRGASHSFDAAADGEKYKARCRVSNKSKTSPWSDYSSEIYAKPGRSYMIRVDAGETGEAYVHYTKVTGATSYIVEYVSAKTATKAKEYMDASSNVQTSTASKETKLHGNPSPHMLSLITGLATGVTWYFRVKAVNSAGESAASEVMSLRVGLKPSPPTTWSSKTSVMIGDPLTLYFVHNSEDGSPCEQYQLKYNGTEQTAVYPQTESERLNNPLETDAILSVKYDTSKTTDGSKLSWAVRTKGTDPKWSDYSVTRTVEFFAPPTVHITLSGDNLTVSNNRYRMDSPKLAGTLACSSGRQKITSVYYEIVVKSSVDDVIDFDGEYTTLRPGDVIYSKLLTYGKNQIAPKNISFSISPGDALLVDNVNYEVHAVISTDAGLTAEDSVTIYADLPISIYIPDVEEPDLNDDDYTLQITPFCLDDRDAPDDEEVDAVYSKGVTLSVYRINFDHSLTLIQDNVANTGSVYVVDPHPPLMNARYRILAFHEESGGMGFYDTEPYEFDDRPIVLQWAERVQSYVELENADPTVVPDFGQYEGTILTLPYNIDTSEKSNPDVELVEYVGRKHPVSYYGTQVGQTATWKCDIEADDTDTIDKLRRLQVWMGDVYCREPSGVGYWANVKVSFSIKHTALTIPVTLELTRVEGGI